MKRFNAFIIRKKTIKKVLIIATILITLSGICVIINTLPPKAVYVFSSPEEIIDLGITNSNEQKSLKQIFKKILGYNKKEVCKTLEESSVIYKNVCKATLLPQTTENSQPINTSEEKELTPETSNTSNIASLPSHEEILLCNNLDIKNATDYNVDLNELCCEPLETNITQCEEPEVLIMHTHTTECYNGDEMSGESERTTNESLNVCAVGNIIAERLEEYGIKTIHDTTIHDYPTYQGSYTRALETINRNINENPQIKMVLDIHRDAFIYKDGSKLRVATNINGEETAQVMMVLGSDSMGLYNPYWKSNLSLACKIQSAANIIAPGLMKPINLRTERFNMHVTKGSILLEVGSNGNTLAEAKNAANYIGTAIAAALFNG